MRRRLALLGIGAALAAACSGAASGHPPSIQSLTLSSKDARLAATLHLPGADRRIPGVVLVHGSGRQTAADMHGNAQRLASMGLAVLAYDKRGVGESTGEYTSIGPANSDRMFDLLASDAIAGVEALARRAEVDPARIGLVGISQGGWIAPLAASRSARVAFLVSISGPAVTVGEEIAYSRLAGEDPGSLQGLSDADIDRQFAAFKGPHGYDPMSAIVAMRCPSLWILGERDRSLPVRQTIANLERVKREHRREIAIHVIPGVNHGLRNPVTGERTDIWGGIADWLAQHGILARDAQR
jgi:dipeptidyl aminopeptidase/acylaminoacyl peptidase